jgi:hypothetical protein
MKMMTSAVDSVSTPNHKVVPRVMRRFRTNDPKAAWVVTYRWFKPIHWVIDRVITSLSGRFQSSIWQYDEDLNEELNTVSESGSPVGRSEGQKGRMEAWGHTSESWLSGF